MLSKKRILGLALLTISVVSMALVGFFIGPATIPTINASHIDPQYDGKLVHVQQGVSPQSLTDPLFKVSAEGSALNRVVSVYQFINETKGNDFSETLIADERGVNPRNLLIKSEKWTGEVKVGALTLSRELTQQLSKHAQTTPMNLTTKDLDNLGESGKKAFKLHENKFYFGLDPQKPDVGDFTVSYTVTTYPKVSIIAQQQGNQLIPFQGTIAKLLPGNHSADSISASLEINADSMTQWYIRIGLIVPLLLGLFLLIDKSGGTKSEDDEPSISEDAEHQLTGNTHPRTPDNQQSTSTDDASLDQEEELDLVDMHTDPSSLEADLPEDQDDEDQESFFDPSDLINEDNTAPQNTKTSQEHLSQEGSEDFFDPMQEFEDNNSSHSSNAPYLDNEYRTDSDPNAFPSGVEVIGPKDIQQNASTPDKEPASITDLNNLSLKHHHDAPSPATVPSAELPAQEEHTSSDVLIDEDDDEDGFAEIDVEQESIDIELANNSDDDGDDEAEAMLNEIDALIDSQAKKAELSANPPPPSEHKPQEVPLPPPPPANSFARTLASMEQSDTSHEDDFETEIEDESDGLDHEAESFTEPTSFMPPPPPPPTFNKQPTNLEEGAFDGQDDDNDEGYLHHEEETEDTVLPPPPPLPLPPTNQSSVSSSHDDIGQYQEKHEQTLNQDVPPPPPPPLPLTPTNPTPPPPPPPAPPPPAPPAPMKTQATPTGADVKDTHNEINNLTEGLDFPEENDQANSAPATPPLPDFNQGEPTVPNLHEIDDIPPTAPPLSIDEDDDEDNPLR